jgi:ACR3 family arsenite efflux pump ArsB
LASTAQTAFLNVAIAAIFASQGAVLAENPLVILRLLGPLLAFYLVTVIQAIWLSRRGGFDYPECASLCLAMLARNSPIALAMAVVAFPEREFIALALVVGPLIELPVLAFVVVGRPNRRGRAPGDGAVSLGMQRLAASSSPRRPNGGSRARRPPRARQW